MVTLIKSQLLKRLSVFTKNLSPDKIQLSTLKGEGNMSDLELDENVLMQVLDLPTWLRLTKAVCNRLSVRIQWTKLKSQPICLFLDEVVIEMETCEVPRDPQTTSPLTASGVGGYYGFAERIIDGMYLSINSVVVNFKATAFAASFQMSRIVIESKTPTWQTGNLRMTRVKDEGRGEILLFKEAGWQTLRIEANALEGSDCDVNTTPLRLIANQSKIRITMKKRLIDCGIVTSRLQVNLDDLLWVLTDSQLKAALVFINSLKDVIKKSSQQSKLHAAEKLKNPSSTQGAPTQQSNRPAQAISELFKKYDITETSYHLHTGRVDLHLCDDAAPDEEYKRKVEGGALQVTLYKLSFDHYPFHVAGTDRRHWLKYDENMASHDVWSQGLYEAFKLDVGRVKRAYTNSPASSPSHTSTDDTKPAPKTTPQGALHPRVAARLLESCFVLRAEDFVVFRVSTTSDSARNTPRRFVSSEKKQLLLPPEMSAFHLEYTDYYFPEGVDFPVPHANLYAMVNPVRLMVDYLTLTWLNSFVLNLVKQLDFTADTGPKFHTDVKIDALMPKIILPARVDVYGQPDRPNGLQIRASRITVSNCHPEATSSMKELGNTLDVFNSHSMFHTSQFPNNAHDLVALPDVYRKHFTNTDGRYFDKSVEASLLGNTVVAPSSAQYDSSAMPTYYNMRTDSLKTDAAKDVWSIHLDQLWMEFVGVASSCNRPVPFMEAVPVTLWVARPCVEPTPVKVVGSHGMTNHVDVSHNSQTHLNVAEDGVAIDTSATMPHGRTPGEVHIIVKVDSKLNVQLNHYQLLFLLRLVDTLTEHQEEICADVLEIMHAPAPKANTVLAIVLREMEFAMICPALPEVHTFATTSREDSSVEGVSPAEDCGKGESDVTLTCNSLGRVDENESVINNTLTELNTENTDNPTSNDASADGLHSHSDTDLLPPSSNSDAAETIHPSHSETDLDKRYVSGTTDHAELPNISVPDDGVVSLASDAGSVQFVNTYAVANGPISPKHTDKGASGDIKKSFNSAFSNFSKGLTSSYSIISEKMKQNMSKHDDDLLGDEWETVSIKSGASSDDDEFAVLKFQNASELPAFECKGWSVSENASVADTASEATDTDPGSTGSTIGGQSAAAAVSVVSFIMRHCDVVIQTTAQDDVIVSAEVQCVDLVEHGNIGLETFQTQLATDTKISRKSEEWEWLDSAPMKMRYQIGPQAELLAETGGVRGYLDCRIDGLRVSMVTSSMTNLADLMEDEKIPPFMPMVVRINNSDITLRDDKPPTHMTSPGVIPVDLSIAEMVMRRTQDGIYHIRGGSSDSVGGSEATKMQLHRQPKDDRIQTLLADNEKLQLEISALRNVTEKTDSMNFTTLRAENERLKTQLGEVGLSNNVEAFNLTTNTDNRNRLGTCQEEQALQRENAELLEQLVQEQEEVKTLREERESFLMTIQLLQEELTASEELRLSHLTT